MPKLRHYDHLNTARFVTFSCYRRHKLLQAPPVIRVFLETLEFVCRQYEIRVFGYVVMPEHVHLVVHPPDSIKLGPVIGQIKSKSASRIVTERLLVFPANCSIEKAGVRRQAFWQPRCYDHNCRSPETVVEKINYCHNNPVKRGLVTEPGVWRWSSFTWYAGEAHVPVAMDELDSGVSD